MSSQTADRVQCISDVIDWSLVMWRYIAECQSSFTLAAVEASILRCDAAVHQSAEIAAVFILWPTSHVDALCQSDSSKLFICLVTPWRYLIDAIGTEGRLKTRDLTSRDWTTRHQIKQIATGWTSVGPRKNWTCWTKELNPVCHDSIQRRL